MIRNFHRENAKELKPKKCKHCKIPFQPRNQLQYICSPTCAIEHKKVLDAKKVDEKVKGMKVNTHAKENKAALQAEINKLARKIDAYFSYGCIDGCRREYGKQIDGAHFHAVGSNHSLRYNLHNIHSADSYCNNYSNVHISGYKLGLAQRYGNEYFEMVEGLPLKYPELRLSNVEIVEKLALVRKINRSFNTYQFIDGNSARTLLNTLIGIYK